MSNLTAPHRGARLGTFDVFVAGVALVVASSTLVSEFTGFFVLGAGFVISLVLAFLFNVLLARSAAELSVAYPRSGALYDYALNVIGGRPGRWAAAFLGLAFFGMSAFGVAGETASGAHALAAVLGLPVEVCVAGCLVLGALPNLLGLRTAAWVSAGLLVAMLALRWLFGIAGFFDRGLVGSWSWSNLTAVELQWLGDTGVISLGLALGIWSFVGIEFACSLASDVRDPGTSMPRGLMVGLLMVLATSLIMGLGVTGCLPPAEWARTVASHPQAGDAPQLAVGAAMFGPAGALLMAVASFAATLGSLTIFFAAMPRLLARLASEGVFGPRGRWLALRSARNGAPVPAIVATLALYAGPSFASAAVVDWIMSAAYIWLCLYCVYHLLAAEHRRQVGRRWGASIAAAGITAVGLVVSFDGQHGVHGGRALVVLIIAATVALVTLRYGEASQQTEASLGSTSGTPELDLVLERA